MSTIPSSEQTAQTEMLDVPVAAPAEAPAVPGAVPAAAEVSQEDADGVTEDVEQLSTTAQADPSEQQEQQQEQQPQEQEQQQDEQQQQQQERQLNEEDKLAEMLRQAKTADGEMIESPAENANVSNLQQTSAQSSPRSAHSSTKGMTEKAMKMLGFENEEQVLRAKALSRMGLTEEDLYKSAPHFCSPSEKERMLRLYEKKGLTDKLPKITGLTEEQLLRRKAVDKLGATENEIDLDRERKLASLGATAAAVYQKEKEPALSCLR